MNVTSSTHAADTKYTNLVGKSEDKGSFWSPSCRQGDNINMNLEETPCENIDWTGLSQDRVKQWGFCVLVNELQVP
jgi:hypothetical protein